MAMACLPSFLVACHHDVTRPNQERMPWDTAFKVVDTGFPDDSIMSRAVVEPGNNHRMSRFFRKCDTARKVTIGFIGGSITEGASATAASARYSSRLCEFLGKSFPGVQIEEMNAGIGATTSRLACSRAYEDLLIEKPDMIVVDFAVNDDINDSATSAATMEGLIRQCLQSADIPVVLFQTMNRFGDSVNHILQRRIAAHYGLPVVGYRNAMWPLVKSGRIPWSALSPDDVHPNDLGHLIGGYLLYSFLKAESRLPGKGNDAPMEVPKALMTDLYQFAGFFNPRDSVLTVLENVGWSLAEDGKRRHNLISMHKGDKVVLRSLAREITLSYHFSRELNSQVQVSLDGSVVDTLSSHFSQDWGGGYLKTRQVYREAAAGEHRIELVNLSGGRFDLRYVLYAR